MNSKRIYYGMVAGLVLLMLAVVGSAYVGNGLLQTQSKKLVDLKLRSQVLDLEKTSLTKAKEDIETYQSLNKIAKSIVPQDKDQANAVREIVKIAAESDIKPSSITFPASTLGTSANGAVPVAGTPAPVVSEGTSALSQLKPVKDIKGVYVLKITITVDPTSPIPYNKFIDFLSRLEQNRRTAQVSDIVLQPTPLDRNMLAFTLTLDEFIKP